MARDYGRGVRGVRVARDETCRVAAARDRRRDGRLGGRVGAGPPVAGDADSGAHGRADAAAARHVAQGAPRPLPARGACGAPASARGSSSRARTPRTRSRSTSAPSTPSAARSASSWTAARTWSASRSSRASTPTPSKSPGSTTASSPTARKAPAGTCSSEIAKYSPKTIAVNQSKDMPLADGLTAGNIQWLRDTLGPEFSKRLVSVGGAPRLLPQPQDAGRDREDARGRQEDRGDSRRGAHAAGHRRGQDDGEGRRGLHPQAPARDGTSGRPGATSTTRTSRRERARGHSASTDAVIFPGAVVHIDAGVDDAGYKTDIQRLAYVLRPGETAAPPEVQKAFDTVKAANRAAAAALKPGVKGTEVDAAGRKSDHRGGLRRVHSRHGTSDRLLHARPRPAGSLRTGPTATASSARYVIERDQTFAIEPSLTDRAAVAASARRSGSGSKRTTS